MKCYRKAVRRRLTLFIFNHSREFFCSFLRIFVVEFSLNSDLLQCVSVNLFMLQELHETKAKISDYVRGENPCACSSSDSFIIFRSLSDYETTKMKQKKSKSREHLIDAYRWLKFSYFSADRSTEHDAASRSRMM